MIIEDKKTAVDTPPDDKDKVYDYDDIINMVITHDDEIKKVIQDVKPVIKDIRYIAEFISKVKKKKTPFLRYFTDKEYVIVGVVGIAIFAMFYIPDPSSVIMSIVSGLFGLGTGRMMSDKDDE